MQKVIAAREFTSDSKVIIADQPTRGIDVGSTEFILGTACRNSKKKKEASVLLVSADLTELLEVSDCILVLCGGEVTAFFPDVTGLNEIEIGEYMLGIKKMSAQGDTGGTRMKLKKVFVQYFEVIRVLMAVIIGFLIALLLLCFVSKDPLQAIEILLL